MSSKRSMIPRSVKVVPLAAASAIVFLVLSMMGLLNFNPPSLDQPAANDSQQETGQQNGAQTDTERTDPKALVAVESKPPAPSTLEVLPVVDVLIDGDDYWVGVSKRDQQWVREKATIAGIVEQVATAAGDGSGIKVRIARTFSATAQAERALHTALTDSGIEADAMDQRRTLLQ